MSEACPSGLKDKGISSATGQISEGLSHIYGPGGLSLILLSQGCTLETAPTVGVLGGQNIHSEDRGEGEEPLMLRSQPAVMSSL